MTTAFERLQVERKSITEEIARLNQERSDVQRELQGVCPHEDLRLVSGGNPYLIEIGAEDVNETKYKCQVCNLYFDAEEFASLKKKG